MKNITVTLSLHKIQTLNSQNLRVNMEFLLSMHKSMDKKNVIDDVFYSYSRFLSLHSRFHYLFFSVLKEKFSKQYTTVFKLFKHLCTCNESLMICQDRPDF